jgi:hypothetical protein
VNPVFAQGGLQWLLIRTTAVCEWPVGSGLQKGGVDGLPLVFTPQQLCQAKHGGFVKPSTPEASPH